MGLPTVNLPRATAELPDGTKLEIRALTRAEIMRGQDAKVGDSTGLEVYVLATALEMPEEKVRVWYENTPAGVVDVLIQAIRELSGLAEDSAKK